MLIFFPNTPSDSFWSSSPYASGSSSVWIFDFGQGQLGNSSIAYEHYLRLVRATTVTVNATDAGASEDGLDSGTFTFTRTGSTATALTVKYAAIGTATEGSDYQNLGTSVTFPAGSSTVTRTVVPIQDSLIEDDETVILTLARNYSGCTCLTSS